MKLASLCALTLSSWFAIGCTTRLTDFTIISTKNLDLSRGASFKRGGGRVEGEDKVHIIVFIPTGTPNMKEAIDRAIESVPGAVALVDGVVSSHAWYIPYIYGQSRYLVEGTPLIDPALATGEPIAAWRLARYDASDRLVESRPLSREEFGALRAESFGG